jgi:hypothetical protein
MSVRLLAADFWLGVLLSAVRPAWESLWTSL